MMFGKSMKLRSVLLVLASLMMVVFGLGGCFDIGGGGGGNGVNYGHNFTVTITDSTAQALAALGLANVAVTTESGTVGTITVDNGVITFSVDDISMDENFVSLTVNLTGYIPLIRQYVCSVSVITDLSGDDFTSILYTLAELNATGTGGGDESVAVQHSPGTGLAAPLTVNGVTAGTDSKRRRNRRPRARNSIPPPVKPSTITSS